MIASVMRRLGRADWPDAAALRATMLAIIACGERNGGGHQWSEPAPSATRPGIYEMGCRDCPLGASGTTPAEAMDRAQLLDGVFRGLSGRVVQRRAVER